MQQGPPQGGGYQYPPSQQPPQQPYPQQYQQPFQQQYAPVGPPTKDPSTGLLLELIGIFGFMGIGWLWAGETAIGIALLLGYGGFLFIEIILVVVTFGLGLICFGPLNLILPIASGLLLQKRMKQQQATLAAQQYGAQQYPGQQYPF